MSALALELGWDAHPPVARSLGPELHRSVRGLLGSGVFGRGERWIAPLIARFANGAARLSFRIRKREDA